MKGIRKGWGCGFLQLETSVDWAFLKEGFICINFIYVFSSIFYTFPSMEHPNAVEPHPLLAAPSAQSSTRLFHHRNGVHLFGPCAPALPGTALNNWDNNCYSSPPWYSCFENFLSYLCLIVYFPRRADVDFLHLELAEGTVSRLGMTGQENQQWHRWSHRGQEEVRLSFTFVWGSRAAQPRLRAALN